MNGRAPWIAAILLAAAGVGLFAYSLLTGSTSSLENEISRVKSLDAPNQPTIGRAANLRKNADEALEAAKAQVRARSGTNIIAAAFLDQGQNFKSQQWPTQRLKFGDALRSLNLINPPRVVNGTTRNFFEDFEQWKARTGGTSMDEYKASLLNTWKVDPLASLDKMIQGKTEVLNDNALLGRVALTCVQELIDALEKLRHDIGAPGVFFQLRDINFDSFIAETSRSSGLSDDAFTHHRYTVELVASPSILPKVLEALRSVTLDDNGPMQMLWSVAEYEGFVPVGVERLIPDSEFVKLGTEVPTDSVGYEQWRVNDYHEAAAKAARLLEYREKLPMTLKVQLGVLLPRNDHPLLAAPAAEGQN